MALLRFETEVAAPVSHCSHVLFMLRHRCVASEMISMMPCITYAENPTLTVLVIFEFKGACYQLHVFHVNLDAIPCYDLVVLVH